MMTQWGWDDEYIHEGVKFHFDGKFLATSSLHPRFILYIEVHCPDLLNRELLETHLHMACLNIMHNKERWIKECEERKGMPPGVKVGED